VPHLCEFYPGICLTTEEKARKKISQGKKNKTIRVSAACGRQLVTKPDRLITKVMGSTRNTHSCWLFLFVHQSVTLITRL